MGTQGIPKERYNFQPLDCEDYSISTVHNFFNPVMHRTGRFTHCGHLLLPQELVGKT
jgi:hypothetical protein